MEHKLFIGMVPKTSNEDELTALFRPFGKSPYTIKINCWLGAIENVSILRGPGNVSKGCAFLRYAKREEALAAINAMNGYKYGCSMLFVLRIVWIEWMV